MYNILLERKPWLRGRVGSCRGRAIREGGRREGGRREGDGVEGVGTKGGK